MNKKTEEEKLALEYKRHSLAHLLAAAVIELFPGAENAIGPAISNGFYQEFDFDNVKNPKTGEQIVLSKKNLPKIQKRMKKILKTWESFEKKELSQDEAKEVFSWNKYKLELVEDIAARGEKITQYTSGNFIDLCRGGHSSDLSTINPEAFELDRMAGVYWKGDENNKMITRIYGLAFDTPEELVQYKELQEEAKKRDHRKLGKELDLYTTSELIGPGLPLFTPKGTLMRDLIIDKIQGLQAKLGYLKVTTPHITKPDLYKKSGHWEKFGEELFQVHGGQTESHMVLKPMNCPHHTQIFASTMRSYRDLPVRYQEAGVVYRDEQAGEMIGLSRVRAITQDDGHIFCTPDQVMGEVRGVISVIKDFYKSLSMLEDENTYWVSLSVRDPKTPEKYLGETELWEKTEKMLEEAARLEGLNYRRVEGEAAFYGPKLDFQFFDALGRERQLSTVQVDMVMPKRFELAYTDTDGEQKTPVMIHRAVAGSLERFLSIAIEHFAGHFPMWLSPVQAVVLPISSEAHEPYADSVFVKLKEAGIRVEYFAANESLGKRVRNARLQKIPYMIVLGDAELEANTLTVEGRGDVKIENISVEDFIARIKEEASE